MVVSKSGNKVEVSSTGIYMYLPANKEGYQLLEREIGATANKYKSLFFKKIVVKKVLK